MSAILLGILTTLNAAATVPPDLTVFAREASSQLKPLEHRLPDFNDGRQVIVPRKYSLERQRRWKAPDEPPEYFPETQDVLIVEVMQSDDFQKLFEPIYQFQLEQPRVRIERHRLTGLSGTLRIENRPVNAYLSPRERRRDSIPLATNRKDRIETIGVVIDVPGEVADAIIAEKLRDIRSLRVHVRVRDVLVLGIESFYPYAHPPRLATIQCELVEVEPRYRKTRKE